MILRCFDTSLLPTYIQCPPKVWRQTSKCQYFIVTLKQRHLIVVKTNIQLFQTYLIVLKTNLTNNDYLLLEFLNF